MANRFILKGHAVEVDYTIGANPNFVALTLKAHGSVNTFKPAEIASEQTDMGQLVSVALPAAADAVGTRFGLFLPQVQVSQGQQAKVSTVGVFETTAGHDVAPHRPTSWRCVELQGVAETVVVPLAQSVPA